MRVAALVGPTSVGKSSVALELASRVPLEIISLDSMAVYRHVPIATDLPSLADRRRVPHHLLDFLEPHQSFSAASYAQMARDLALTINSRGHLPLFVGGSYFHLRVLMEGLDTMPPANPELRAQHEDVVRLQGPHALWECLNAKDATMAAKLHPQDVRRVSRALEVFGSPRESKARQPGIPEANWLLMGITLGRDQIYRRCNERAKRMFSRGLVEEVHNLLTLNPGQTLLQAVGVKEVIAHLKESVTLDEAIRAVQQATRRLAKHQITWGKRFNIQWFGAEDRDLVSSLAGCLA